MRTFGGGPGILDAETLNGWRRLRLTAWFAALAHLRLSRMRDSLRAFQDDWDCEGR